MMMMMLRAFFTTRRDTSLFVPRGFSSSRLLDFLALFLSRRRRCAHSLRRDVLKLSLICSAELFVINGSFWKLFFQIVTQSFPPFARAYSNTTHARYYERVYQREIIFTQNIHTHTYIYILKQRENEFWRHAPRGRTQGNTRAQICSRMCMRFRL